jgi:DGQHR domain-containing protein
MSENFDELDDFDSIEDAGTKVEQIIISQVFPVKIGGFGDDKLKTYIGNVKIEDLESDIQFYETLSKDKSWPVSQIIQREVDKIRVSNISKDYILRKTRAVKYFPPIIIALLPKGQDEKIGLNYTFNNQQDEDLKEFIFDKSNYRSNEKLKPIFRKAPNKSKVDGLFVLEVSKVFDFNVICWDKAKYFAVVIDGQHRLEALFESKKQDPEVAKYIQDVVFIDFSNLVKEDDEGECIYTPIELVRRVFIDINTNAKPVGPVRQILMDDKDLAAIFVQSLVDSVNKDGTDKDQKLYIRPQMVDWYGKGLKHSLPHVTGILSLYQILSDYLLLFNISSINDLRNSKLIEKWVKRLNDYFFIDKEIDLKTDDYKGIEKLIVSLEKFRGEQNLKQEYDEALDDDLKETTLFEYDYSVLEIAKKVFEDFYVSSIVEIFNELLPYKETLQIIDDNKGLSSDSLLSEALLASPNKIIANKGLKDSMSEIKMKLTSNLDDKYYLIFTVLGQKSIFNNYFKRLFKCVSTDFNNEKALAVTRTFIFEFNELVNICSMTGNSPFGKKDEFVMDIPEGDPTYEYAIGTNFWEGIIYENNKIIYNSQGISSLSSVIDFMLLCVKRLKNEEVIDDVSFEINFMKLRTQRILKRATTIEDDQLVDKVIENKSNFIKKYIIESYEKYKSSVI